MKAKHIAPLTSLRFIFAFMVFCCHSNYLLESESEFVKELYLNVLLEGYVGVSFFFILSGFILSYNYERIILNKSISYRSFIIARLARIYPLTLVGLFVSIPITVYYLVKKFSIVKIVSIFFFNLVLSQSYIPVKEIYQSFNSPDWSISTEFFFYIVFPILVGFSKKRTFWIYISVLILLLIFFMSTLNVKWHHSIFYIHPFTRILDFILGILVYIVFKSTNLMRNPRTGTFLEISAILIFILFFTLHTHIEQVYRFSVYYWLPMCFLIFVFAKQNGLFSKLLSHRHMVYLGKISFAFYIFHQIVIKYLIFLNPRLLEIRSSLLLVTIAFVLTFIISHFAHKFIEEPSRNYIKTRFTKSV